MSTFKKRNNKKIFFVSTFLDKYKIWKKPGIYILI